MKRTAILMVGVLLLTFGGEAVARPGGPMSERIGPPAFLRGLIRPETVMRNQRAVNLSDAQREQIQEAMREARNEIEELRWELQAEADEVRTLLRATPIDREEVLAAAEQIFELESKLKVANLGLLIEITNALTPEQVEELRALQKERRSRGGRRDGNGKEGQGKRGGAFGPGR